MEWHITLKRVDVIPLCNTMSSQIRIVRMTMSTTRRKKKVYMHAVNFILLWESKCLGFKSYITDKIVSTMADFEGYTNSRLWGGSTNKWKQGNSHLHKMKLPTMADFEVYILECGIFNNSRQVRFLNAMFSIMADF